MKPIHHLLALSVVLIGASGVAFHSQGQKRHLMAAVYFDAIAQSLEDQISPGISSLAEWQGMFDGDESPFPEWARGAGELVVTARALRTEANVLRCWAEGDAVGARQYIGEWRDESIQNLVRQGIYPANLGHLIRDHEVYLEFIRIRNQYIDPETHHWKLGT